MSEVMYLPGATTVGVVFKDGVLLTSEKRLTYGSFVLSKAVKKVFPLTDHIAAACAGLVSDMQSIVRVSSAYLKLQELEINRKASVKSAAKLMSNMLFEMRLFPLLTQTLVGGVDDEGPSLYVLDPLGSVMKDDYATVGSGAEIAIGILEARYRQGLEWSSAKELAVAGMRAAMARDAASGDGIDILRVTAEGISEEYVPVK
ncbi:MAG: archaeal proteasome endopeptidase complex subunit beta [Candidatus Bathyarchaeia archaeon]